ncbi:hypothetical protein GJ744_006778 [Endocarpon pusillum]|uniref:Uncharacterized protein n=1 Tax=Endocarpon pusillum TaxID=364733 RepID=A0A8H7A751_9EURO|nr:hypothetical protein GJ744_006778 [Endocarpon pusillum]
MDGFQEFLSRSLIFITYYFSRLIVLKALLNARAHEDDWPGLFLFTTSLIFFGTPFRGAEDISQTEMLAAARSKYYDDDI